jgi:hypothetical protein
VAKFVAMIAVILVAPKVGAKHELLFNKRASGAASKYKIRTYSSAYFVSE